MVFKVTCEYVAMDLQVVTIFTTDFAVKFFSKEIMSCLRQDEIKLLITAFYWLICFFVQVDIGICHFCMCVCVRGGVRFFVCFDLIHIFYLLAWSAIFCLFFRSRIDHFTVVCLVTWPLDGSEAEGDLVLIKTSLLLLCKTSCSDANLVHLHHKSRELEVCSKTRPTPASLSSKGRVTEQTTVKRSVVAQPSPKKNLVHLFKQKGSLVSVATN